MKKIDISIPSPCSEKWDSFRPTQKGGFCSKCEKEIINFSNWTEERLIAYFRNSGGAACGRFRKTQLKQYHLASPAQSTTKWLPLSLLSLAIALSTRNADGRQIKTQPHALVQSKELDSRTKEVAGNTLTKVLINGVVRYKTDQSGLPGVTVRLEGTLLETVTDAEGHFSITIPQPRSSDVLIFSFIGLITVKQNVYSTNDLTIWMEDDVLALEEPVYMGLICNKTKPTVWQRFKNLFR